MSHTDRSSKSHPRPRFAYPKGSPHKPGVLEQWARELRACPTPSEHITDFVAAEVGLVVEVDGGYHPRRRRADTRRDAALARAGYRVLRLEAELVLRDIAGAVERVREAIESVRCR